MQLEDHLQFIGSLGVLGFKNVECTHPDDWLAEKNGVTVVFMGNSIQPFLGDIVIKKDLQKTRVFKNHSLDEYGSAYAYVKELLCTN